LIDSFIIVRSTNMSASLDKRYYLYLSHACIVENEAGCEYGVL
jgi:hypothetical protein